MSARLEPSIILYAEDDASDVVLLDRVVRQHFPTHRLHVVRDGEEAVTYLTGGGPYRDRARFPVPRLVLLDVRLPKMDGLEVLFWIRQQPALRGLVVLMLTGSDSEEHLRRAYELHANSYLKKHPLLALPEMSKTILEYWLSVNQLPGA